MSTSGALRGHLLTPTADGPPRLVRDTAVRWADGRIVELGGSHGEGLEDELLLVPGFVDVHVHLPQHRVRGRFQEALLPWLRDHIWPEEMRFAEREYRDGCTAEFRDGLVGAGTTSAMVYGSPLGDSAHAVLSDLEPLCIKGGDVLMDRNGPDAVLRRADAALVESSEHIATYGERYVLTPRFVPTCTAELMAACGRLLTTTDARMQTHLSENLDEIAWVKELHPESDSYTAVYAAAGLLGPKSVFGHCIHLDDSELRLLADSGSWVAHCPTSNVALGSGRMPLERIRAADIPLALATDVGAGPELSMLHVIATFLAVHAGFVDVSPTEGLTLATRAGARCIGEPERGTLEVGKHADLVGLRLPGGLRRGEDGDAALGRILREFDGRWDEAVAVVVAGGLSLR